MNGHIEAVKKLNRKTLVMLLVLIIVAISITFGYKFILYKYNLSKLTNTKDPKASPISLAASGTRTPGRG